MSTCTAHTLVIILRTLSTPLTVCWHLTIHPAARRSQRGAPHQEQQQAQQQTQQQQWQPAARHSLWGELPFTSTAACGVDATGTDPAVEGLTALGQGRRPRRRHREPYVPTSMQPAAAAAAAAQPAAPSRQQNEDAEIFSDDDLVLLGSSR